MPQEVEKSDRAMLELLRQFGALNVQELMERLAVTATAVRQRLDRVVCGGFVAREEVRAAGRGRPSHRYVLTESGLRAVGHNMAELATVLWSEIRQIADEKTRQQLMASVSSRMAELYGASKMPVLSVAAARSLAVDDANERQASGAIASRMESLAEVLRASRFPAMVEREPNSELPILKINGCPYPDLSGETHEICEVETVMLSKMLGHPLNLRHCRCDSSDGVCTFELATK